MTSRRALLSSFLAAPVAVRLGRWVKPAGFEFGSATITLAAGTFFAPGDYIFIPRTVFAPSEWLQVQSVTRHA